MLRLFLIFIFFLIIVPVSLLKKIIGSSKLQHIKIKRESGWYRMDWDTGEKTNYVVVHTGEKTDPLLTGESLFRHLKIEKSLSIFALYRILAWLSPLAKTREEERTLPTDRYVMF